MSGESLAAVQAAARSLEAARAALQQAVDEARDAGESWAAIGAALGTSRQAAFKRFGRPRDPRSGEAMTRRTAEALVAITERVFQLIAAGDDASLRPLIREDAAATLTAELIARTWADVVAATGEFERCEATRVETSDGAVLADEDDVVGSAIGATTVVCEAGQWSGRVAFDADDQITGLLILPPGAASPF
ncbi:hypothetical protein [Janibacter sp. GXQ6167]|uniref:hypothetical protein n=1 Tax=Janibacter sp. GXQ6167 TaxID=3240791 RepID=UPI003524EBB2